MGRNSLSNNVRFMSVSRPSPPARQRRGFRPLGATLPHIPALDGLRALAVLAVLLYHADLPIAGGFLGVDIFFVLSGYLITALLLTEWRASGEISLAGFWVRRLRRLLPALLLLLAGVLAFAVLLLPEEVARLRNDVLAALTYSTNWYLIVRQESYFDAIGRASLLQHLWSLAIEEQFYLVWPPLLAWGLRRWGVRPMVWVALISAALSAAWMALLYNPDVDPSRLYYGTDTRAFALLFGAALGLVWVPGSRVAGNARGVALLLDVIGLAALGGLGWLIMTLGEFDQFAYQGGFVLAALCSTVLIGVAVHPRARAVPWLLRLPWLQWLGERSYGAYLWHWPVFMLTRPELDVPPSGALLVAVRIGATLAISELSFWLLEHPIRSGRLGRSWRALWSWRGPGQWWRALRWLLGGSAAVGCVAALGITAAEAVPPPPPEELVVGSTLANPADGTPIPVVALAATAAPSPTATPTLPPTTTAIAATVAAATPTALPTAAPLRITAVGDSVMVGAAKALHAALDPNITIDAKVGRQAGAAIAVLQAHSDNGTLGDVVVVHIGDNGTFSAEHFDRMMAIIGPERRAIFLTVKVPRRWETGNNKVINDGATRYPNVRLIDWHTIGGNEPRYFRDDGIHLHPPGAQAYAALVAEAAQQR